MPDPYAVVPDEALAELLKQQIKYPIVGVMNLQLMLFVDPEEITRPVVLADLVPADFLGYSEVTLARADWGEPVVEDHVAESVWGTEPVSWTNDGPPQIIRGAAYYDPSSNQLRKVDVFAEPVELPSNHQLQYLPKWTYQSRDEGPPS